jgi:hypothetical protein
MMTVSPTLNGALHADATVTTGDTQVVTPVTG